MERNMSHHDVQHEPASRPGVKTLVLAVIVAIMIYTFYHWAAIKTAFAFL